MTPPGSPAPHGQIEIACDESGFAGGNLVGRGHSTVFAHASVQIEPGTAHELIGYLRREIGARGVGEYKSPEILRPRRRPILLWFLGPDSPVHGNAYVHLTDTRFFVLARLLDVLLGEQPVRGIAPPGRNARTRAMALTLYQSGEQSYGTARWQQFLVLSANLLRTNSRWVPQDAVQLFYAEVDSLAQLPAPTDVRQVINLLAGTRAVAEVTRASHLHNPKLPPLIEPLLPAMSCAVARWGVRAHRLSVVHDEQSALTPERIAEIATTFATSHPGHRLIDVRLVDSTAEPRVQVADFVAGIARRWASDRLQGQPDVELSDLLSPLVDQESVWVRQ
jgi:hypothetical protein